MYFLFLLLTSPEEVSSDFEAPLTPCLWCFLKLVDSRSHPKPPRSLEEEMVTQSGALTWEIPWTEEPGRLQSMGSQKTIHVLSAKKQQCKRNRHLFFKKE